MTGKIVLTAALILSLITAAAAQESDSHRHAAITMIRAYEVKSYEERGRDVAETLVQAGAVPADSLDRLAGKMGELLGSNQFMNLTAEVYMKHLSEEELIRITESIGDPAMQKFLSIRFAIMQDSMSRITELFDEFGITDEIEGTAPD